MTFSGIATIQAAQFCIPYGNLPNDKDTNVALYSAQFFCLGIPEVLPLQFISHSLVVTKEPLNWWAVWLFTAYVYVQEQAIWLYLRPGPIRWGISWESDDLLKNFCSVPSEGVCRGGGDQKLILSWLNGGSVLLTSHLGKLEIPDLLKYSWDGGEEWWLEAWQISLFSLPSEAVGSGFKEKDS